MRASREHRKPGVYIRITGPQDSASPSFFRRRKVIGDLDQIRVRGRTTRTQFSRPVTVFSRFPLAMAWPEPVPPAGLSGGSVPPPGRFRPVNRAPPMARSCPGPPWHDTLYRGLAHDPGEVTCACSWPYAGRPLLHARSIHLCGHIGQSISAFQTALQHRSDDARLDAGRHGPGPRRLITEHEDPIKGEDEKAALRRWCICSAGAGKSPWAGTCGRAR